MFIREPTPVMLAMLTACLTFVSLLTVSAVADDQQVLSDLLRLRYGSKPHPLWRTHPTPATFFKDEAQRELAMKILMLDEDGAKELLTSRRAEIKAGGPTNLTVIHNAAAIGQAEHIALALKLGADPNVASTGGETPLEYTLDRLSIAHDPDDVVEPPQRWGERFMTLVEGGADGRFASDHFFRRTGSGLGRQVVNDTNDGYSARETVEMLKSADLINDVNWAGRSVLFVAYYNNRIDLSYELLQAGANPHIASIHGETFYVEGLRRGPKYVEQTFDAAEQKTLERVHEMMDALEHDEELIAQAAEIDQRRKRLAAEYFKTPRGQFEAAQSKEMKAITDALQRAQERKTELKKQSKDPSAGEDP